MILLSKIFSLLLLFNFLNADSDNVHEWMKTHDKIYHSAAEIEQRFETFKSNHLLVRELNRIYKDRTEFALNQFADMTPQEFKSKVLVKSLSKPFKTVDKSKFLPPINNQALPDSFDWREHGAVTPVRDQGSVGTCWAHSASQNLEGVHFLRGNPLTSLSVEQIVDCDGMQSDSSDDHADCGVYGGWPYLAIEFIKKIGGIAREEDYAYCVGTGKCSPCGAPGYNRTRCGPPIPYCYLKDSCQAKLDQSKFVPNLKVSDWKRTSENETDIAVQLMNYGPLSVALNAELLQFYHKGVFDPIMCNKNELNHAVLMVGWGVDNSKIHGQKPYWIVKNSWGTKWGESGYFRILRNKEKCGINTQVVTAILE